MTDWRTPNLFSLIEEHKIPSIICASEYPEKPINPKRSGNFLYFHNASFSFCSFINFVSLPVKPGKKLKR
jgi:hypothetical protein